MTPPASIAALTAAENARASSVAASHERHVGSGLWAAAVKHGPNLTPPGGILFILFPQIVT